ncbi:MAG: hypothetical protein JXR94_11565 [Candidatus Hydrogenedentes bacterium]|nr:hypothetical protein [Candidatus Hydrogenedentota bacterium]
MGLMHPALWVLFRLRLRGLGRRVLRGVKSPKGAISFALGLGVFCMWLAPSLLMASSAKASDLERLHTVYPMIVFGLTAVTLLTSAGERAIYFNPAEVAFLFAGPFSRRQLLVFKQLISVMGVLFSAVIFAVIMARFGAVWYAAYVGVFLTLLFVHFLTTAVMLVGQMFAERAYTRLRKAILAGLGAAVVVSVWPVVSAGADRGLVAILTEARQAGVLRYLLIPLEPFARATTAVSVFPDLVLWAGVCLAANAILFALVIRLDAEYRDAAVAISQRMHGRIERARRSGMAAGTGTTARWRMPGLPWFGGAGPIAWRQLTNAARNSRGLLMMVMFLGIGVGAPLLVKGREFEGFWALLASALIWLTIMLTMALRFDFRADLDQMDWLKMLPIRPLAIAAGQVVTPVLLCTALHAAALGFAGYLQGMPEVAAAAVVFAIPLNVLLFGTENVLFLLFPIRQAVFSPGDFQMFGRQLLMMLVKMIVAAAGSGIAFAAGAVVYWLAGGSMVAGGAAAWFVLAAVAASSIPLGAWAFRRFDISTDMPA